MLLKQDFNYIMVMWNHRVCIRSVFLPAAQWHRAWGSEKWTVQVTAQFSPCPLPTFWFSLWECPPLLSTARQLGEKKKNNEKCRGKRCQTLIKINLRKTRVVWKILVKNRRKASVPHKENKACHSVFPPQKLRDDCSATAQTQAETLQHSDQSQQLWITTNFYMIVNINLILFIIFWIITNYFSIVSLKKKNWKIFKTSYVLNYKLIFQQN